LPKPDLPFLGFSFSINYLSTFFFFSSVFLDRSRKAVSRGPRSGSCFFCRPLPFLESFPQTLPSTGPPCSFQRFSPPFRSPPKVPLHTALDTDRVRTEAIFSFGSLHSKSSPFSGPFMRTPAFQRLSIFPFFFPLFADNFPHFPPRRSH